MALLAKKLHILNTSGTEQTCGIYGTTGEAGSNYMYATVDGQNAYIPLCSVSAAHASYGRVSKNGATYAIARATTPAYGSKLITTAGSGTFTVPTGVYRLKVTCVGGGAGGVECSADDDDFTTISEFSRIFDYTIPTDSPTATFAASAGNKTQFGSVVANGATAAIFNLGGWKAYSYYVSTSEYTGYKVDTRAGYVQSITPSQGTTNGTIYMDTSSNIEGYNNAVSIKNINGTVVANVGSGGGCDGDDSSVAHGGSGFTTITFINVKPSDVISYTVGSGGMARNGYNGVTTSGYYHSGDSGAVAGKAGGILVEWGVGVQE